VFFLPMLKTHASIDGREGRGPLWGKERTRSRGMGWASPSGAHSAAMLNA
jgi:hypothetical protein